MVAIGVILIMVMHVSADNFRRVKPEDVGFLSDKWQRIKAYFSDRVENGELYGAVFLVFRHGKIVLTKLSATRIWKHGKS